MLRRLLFATYQMLSVFLRQITVHISSLGLVEIKEQLSEDPGDVLPAPVTIECPQVPTFIGYLDVFSFRKNAVTYLDCYK